MSYQDTTATPPKREENIFSYKHHRQEESLPSKVIHEESTGKLQEHSSK